MACPSHTAWLASFLSDYCTTPSRTTSVPSSALFMGCLLQMHLNLFLPNSGSTVSSHQSSQKQQQDNPQQTTFFANWSIGDVFETFVEAINVFLPLLFNTWYLSLMYMVKTSTRLKQSADHIHTRVETLAPKAELPGEQKEFPSCPLAQSLILFTHYSQLD